MSAQVDTGQKLKEMGDEEREKFIQAIAQSLIQNARENGNNAVNMESQANAGSGNGNRAARCRELKKASRASKKKNHDKPLKPLNSFMAYRSELSYTDFIIQPKLTSLGSLRHYCLPRCGPKGEVWIR